MEKEMRGFALFHPSVEYPVRCALCGTKSVGIWGLFWFLPCEIDPNHY